MYNYRVSSIVNLEILQNYHDNYYEKNIFTQLDIDF